MKQMIQQIERLSQLISEKITDPKRCDAMLDELNELQSQLSEAWRDEMLKDLGEKAAELTNHAEWPNFLRDVEDHNDGGWLDYSSAQDMRLDFVTYCDAVG